MAALSDGVFAIALTLLVLDISIPPGLGSEDFHSELRQALPNLGAYALSFAVLAQFWRDQYYVLTATPDTDDTVVHLALLGLALVALMPFTTAVLAEYAYTQPLAVAVYAAGAAAVNAVHLALLRRAHRRTPAGADVPSSAALRRLNMADLGASAAIFAATVPIAFLSPTAGMLCWIAIIPLKAVVAQRQVRIDRRARSEA
ncbi:TMEM175 family protein [Streptomyces durbertensis]|uniref:TMEM175 family protein n=1 Tax=Streptomyces durbertensis TaxID=2448886 RepID=UPI001E43BBFB|nr:TMEM175 family protein [Streptomyces durbertensis]